MVLEKELDRDGSVDEWEVNLVLEGWDRPVEVAQSESETPAREEATSLASRLDLPLKEVTDA